MARRSLVVALAVVALGAGVPAWAADLSTRLYAHPGHEVDWERGQGLPDGTRANYGLHFSKTKTDAPKHAGAAIGGSTNSVTTLGYDLRGACEAGLWFWVEYNDGVEERFRCDSESAIRTQLTDDWMAVKFDLSGRPPVENIHLCFSPSGTTGDVYVDNIQVNSSSVGKPGKG